MGQVHQETVEKKGKKNKQSEENLKDVGEHKDAVQTRVEDGIKLSNDDKKRKSKKKHKVGNDAVQFIATQSEGVNLKPFVDVDGSKMEKDQRKKRKSELIEAFVDVDGNEMEKDQRKKRKSEQINKDEKEFQKSRKKDTGEFTKKKGKMKMEGGDVEVKNNTIDRADVGKEQDQWGGKITDTSEYAKKKRKREKKNHDDGLEAGSQEILDEKLGNESSRIEDKGLGDNGGDAHSTENKKGERTVKGDAVNAEDSKKDRKKAKSGTDVLGGKGGKGVPRTKTNVETTDVSKNPTHKATPKRVSFSDHVEVFPPYDGPSDEKSDKEEDLVRGKRFSLEEDEKIKEAVYNYIEAHELGEDGLNMVLYSKSHPEVKGCWKEIGTALPRRPCESVYYRAHILFERAEKRSWTPEEYELVRKFHEKHGSNWRALGEALGKHRFHVKDTYRRIKLPNMKKGRWSQEEYQSLFDLVNMDLRMKAFEEKKSKHGMLRDNICWGAISDKLSTRTNALCCMKWYDQLTSSMVAEGNWADADDYRLLNVLYSLDACSMEEVDWDCLLEHRSGDLCRKRWNQMVKHIGEHANKQFAEQVEILSQRYCPDVLEAREAYDQSPAVPCG